MSTDSLTAHLKELRAKQKNIDETWKNTGNKPLLNFLVDLIPRALECERCSIFILNPESDNVWLQCGTELEEREVTVRLNDSMVGRVISSGKFHVEHNMENRSGGHEWVDVQTGFVTHNAMCVPILSSSENEVIGVIQILNKKPNFEFEDEDREILEKLALHIHTNIENIFLRQQMVELLKDVGIAIKKIEAHLEK